MNSPLNTLKSYTEKRSAIRYAKKLAEKHSFIVAVDGNLNPATNVYEIVLKVSCPLAEVPQELRESCHVIPAEAAAPAQEPEVAPEAPQTAAQEPALAPEEAAQASRPHVFLNGQPIFPDQDKPLPRDEDFPEENDCRREVQFNEAGDPVVPQGLIQPQDQVQMVGKNTMVVELKDEEGDGKLHKSLIERPCVAVMNIAERMHAENPNVKRREVMVECEKAGIAYYTARTQYQQWLTVRKEMLQRQAAQAAKAVQTKGHQPL